MSRTVRSFCSARAGAVWQAVQHRHLLSQAVEQAVQHWLLLPQAVGLRHLLSQAVEQAVQHWQLLPQAVQRCFWESRPSSPWLRQEQASAGGRCN